MYLFYNNSSYDGFDPAAGASDDAAVAVGKMPRISGASGPANYTDYVHGINGIMIDLAGAHGTIAADDLIFSLGDARSPHWFNGPQAPPPLEIIVRPGAGLAGSDRIYIVWADGAIKNVWLQVIIRANADTGLASDYTFYFGNQVGEIGDDAGVARVNAVDALAVINRLVDDSPGARDATLADPHDFDRDGRITAKDAMIVLNRVLDEHNKSLEMFYEPPVISFPLPEDWPVYTISGGLDAVAEPQALANWATEADELDLSWVAPPAPATLMLEPDVRRD